MTTAIDYDHVPYDSVAMAQTHPSRLGGIAHLCGLKSAPAGSARVLELGCAEGGNIIPMAAGLPDAEFVGIDFSASQIDTGLRLIEKLGLTNCTLTCADIATVKIETEFDYIIAHGVYSWVAEDVRNRLLQICVDCLRPQGVAYISFNTLPGWRLRQVTREFMLFHGRHTVEATDRLSIARAGIDWLANGASGASTGYQQMLKAAANQTATYENSYLFHEYLEGVNHPQYFAEFVERVNKVGLEYLSEAKLRGSLASQLSGVDLPENLSRTELEQYYDFLVGRQFRRSILHRGRDRIDPERFDLNEMSFSAISDLAVDDELSGGARIRFSEGQITVVPGVTCSLLRLFASHWPEPALPTISCRHWREWPFFTENAWNISSQADPSARRGGGQQQQAHCR
ncbi:MAG: class I SAM-dependent methyltransferase [Proteobacteria bacterium]|nr:class I SAM-dependent methyltransferase [Pseudomonadota bacterium]